MVKASTYRKSVLFPVLVASWFLLFSSNAVASPPLPSSSDSRFKAFARTFVKSLKSDSAACVALIPDAVHFYIDQRFERLLIPSEAYLVLRDHFGQTIREYKTLGKTIMIFYGKGRYRDFRRGKKPCTCVLEFKRIQGNYVLQSIDKMYCYPE
ncbi:MAG: hypothetical protein GXO82_08900, partial [Chlorobi bacterium]|nr:hypothetical protein [Chlorobiota bacterium]